MATHLSYYAYNRHAPLECPSCGWRGTGDGRENLHSELLDVCCPECDEMLLIVGYPTAEETRAAAAGGNPEAQAALADVEERETFLARAHELELEWPSQLPKLPDPEVRIEWDIEERDGEHWTILRHRGEEIWREIAYYEGFGRFKEVFSIVRMRYRSRFVEMRPTQASELYLYGDALGAPGVIEKLNDSLRSKGDG